MTQSAPERFDFREAAALGESALAFRSWIEKSSTFLADFLAELTGNVLPVRVDSLQTNLWNTVLASIDRNDYCFDVHVNETFKSIIWAPVDQLRPLVECLMCVSSGEETDSDETENAAETDDLDAEQLSRIEESLVDLLIEHLCRCLQDGWMGAVKIELTPSAIIKNPRRTRLFQSKELIANAELRLQLGNETECCLRWALPKQHFNDLLDSLVDPHWQPVHEKLTSELAGQVPIELVSVLGESTIPMSRLSDLKVGDLIQLDRRIDKPICININDEAYYDAWPGRIGNQQALEIVKCRVHEYPQKPNQPEEKVAG